MLQQLQLLRRIVVQTVDKAWQALANKYSLSSKTIEQLTWYANTLIEWNERMNLTAITDMQTIISHHLDDSLALSLFVDMQSVSSIADVGTGAGFPLLPLKIAFPHLRAVGIEVVHKRITFLEHVVEHLKLEDVEISDVDWRNFLRVTTKPVEYVLA